MIRIEVRPRQSGLRDHVLCPDNHATLSFENVQPTPRRWCPITSSHVPSREGQRERGCDIIANMPDQPPQNNPVLMRFHAALAELYGNRLERVVLYGSRARGDHRADSDYDIAVFIKDAGSFYDEAGRLAEITTDILDDTGAVISATPFAAGAYRDRTGFMHELRKDGVDL